MSELYRLCRDLAGILDVREWCRTHAVKLRVLSGPFSGIAASDAATTLLVNVLVSVGQVLRDLQNGLTREALAAAWNTGSRSRVDELGVLDDVRTAFRDGASIAALAREHQVSRVAIRTAAADLQPGRAPRQPGEPVPVTLEMRGNDSLGEAERAALTIGREVRRGQGFTVHLAATRRPIRLCSPPLSAGDRQRVLRRPQGRPGLAATPHHRDAHTLFAVTPPLDAPISPAHRPWGDLMRRSSSPPPPRWLRRTIAFAPAVGMTLCTSSVLLVHPTLIDVVTVTLSVLAVLPLWWFARRELRADRHATPLMADRYRTLARLLDDTGDGGVLVDTRDQVAIMLVDERHENGFACRAFMRFDRNELAEAADAAWRTPVVFHQFTLDTARPVVRHRVGAVTFTRGEDGHTRMTDVPQPPRRRRDFKKTAFLLDRTAADIPPVPDLDVLIGQLQAGTTHTA